MKDLISYDNSSITDLLSDTSSVNSFAKVVGDLTSSLAKPITDYKKISVLETVAIVKGRQDTEVRKSTIEAIRQALISGNLSPEAQKNAIKTLEKLNFI